MPFNNRTIDQNRLEVFNPAEREPEIMNVTSSAHPFTSLLFKIAITGNLAAARELTDMAKFFIHGGKSLRSTLITKKGHIEKKVKVGAYGNTVRGSGVKTIDNTPAEAWTTARWGFHKIYTAGGLPQDEFGMAAGNDAIEVALETMSLMTAAYEGMFQEMIELLAIDIFSTNTEEEDGILSLKAGFDVSATSTTTYGGISRNTFTAWRGNYATGSNTNWLLSTSPDFSTTRIANIIDTVAANGALPNDGLIVMGATAHEGYRRALTNVATSTYAQSGGADFGHGKSLPFRDNWAGDVPIMMDPDAGVLDVFYVDTRTTRMIGVAGNVFRLTKWSLSETSTQEWSRLWTFANLIATKPNNNFYYQLS